MSIGPLLSIHLLGVVIWVGGMFFAHMILRPVAVSQFEPPIRLRLWGEVLNRFFFWIWIVVFIIPVSGLWVLFSYFGGFSNPQLYLHLMTFIGLVMIGIYIYLYFRPFRALQRLIIEENWPAAGAKLNAIRQLVTTNLILGIATCIIAVGGRYFN